MNEPKSLNPQQLAAITHEGSPLLIIAGAGTGKTTVITERIKYFILEKQIDPRNILALTFTDKASHEMEERVDIALPYGYTQMWISTFHAFCDRILRDEAYAIGLDSGYKLISETEAILLMQKNIFDLGLKIFRPLSNPTKFLDSLLTHFSRLKDEDITPEQYMKWAQKQKPSEESEQYLELATAYKNYEALKIKESVMDFSDLIANTLLLFRTRKNILQKYQKQFSQILVDEFQDTNYAQNELAILLAGNEKNITVVADDDQSIYRFRGAAVSNVLQFKKNFPDAKIITLTENYRSTQIILDAAYSLIQHNNPHRLEVVENINKRLKAQASLGKNDIGFIHTVRAEDEADEIAKKINELTKKDFSYKDIAILVRANNHAQLITTALQRHKIPYQFLGPGYLFQQEEVKDLIAYLTFLTNLSDSVSLFRVLSMDVFKISPVELNYLLNFGKKKNLTLFETLSHTNQSFLTQETQQTLQEFKKMTERHLKNARRTQAGQILYYFLVDSGLYANLQKANSLTEERRVGNIAKFFDRVKKFETEREDGSIYTLSQWLSLMLQMGDSPLAADIDMQQENAVNILTVHASKGLEFPVVFLVNLVSERFPSRERAEKIPLPQELLKEQFTGNTDFHLEEERRLFYVGMTRAKNQLFFTAANYYGIGKRAKKLSPFIFEAVPKLQKENSIPATAQQLSLTEVLTPYEKESLKDSVEEGKNNFAKVTYLTYSNLQTFDICPLHYKAKVLFNIPTPTSSVQSFGISLHNALYTLYRQIQERTTPSQKNLLELLEKEWISEGYSSKKHEEERFSQAKKILQEFYEKESKDFTKPLELELPFSFTLKNGVKVFGKIDRIDKNGNGIEIIDYKTGQDNPRAEKSHQLQLAMYALAATRVKDPILNKDPKDITLTLHFLDGNTKKSMQFSKEDLDVLENTLIKKVEEIEKSDFACSGNILCLSCEYKMLCKIS